jgi:hypothetical protein
MFLNLPIAACETLIIHQDHQLIKTISSLAIVNALLYDIATQHIYINP